jgi:RNA recognition motif-containing protein
MQLLRCIIIFTQSGKQINKELSLNILVRNLSRAVTERELALMFMRFGKVKSFNIVTDQKTGVSKGFGFVDMPEESEARAAIKALDGKVIRGQRIRVKTSTKPSQTLKDYKPEGDWKEHSQPGEIKGVHKKHSSTAGPTGRFTGKPADKSAGKLTERPAGRSNRRFTGKPAEKSSDRSDEKSYSKPAGGPADRPTDRPSGRPTRRFTEKPTERPTSRSAGKSTKRTTGRPAGRPGRPERS